MTSWVKILLFVGLLCASGLNTAWSDSDGCQDERIKRLTKKGDCRAFPMIFRRLGKNQTSQVLKVLRVVDLTGEVGYRRYSYHVKLQSGEYVDLGYYRPLDSYPFRRSLSAENHLIDSLSIDPSNAGGTCCLSPELFYHRAIVKIGHQYCVSYFMLHPFRGSFHDCDGVARPQGVIGYVKDAVSWDQARQIACEKFNRETGRPCKDSYHRQLSTKIQRASDGSLFYITAFRRFIRREVEKATAYSTPVQYDYLTYRIDAVGGKIRLLETTADFPDYKKWMN